MAARVQTVVVEVIETMYSFIDKAAFDFERNFKAEPAVKWAGENWQVSVAIVIIYMMGIQIGTAQAAKWKQPFDLKYPLAIWNAFLSLFSIIGMCKTVPLLLHNLVTTSYEDTVCKDGLTTWGNGTTGFWVFLFIFSKTPELFDTMFIVLRRKPLIFLHWYHHVTVLLFCWNSYATCAASGLYFVTMNYSVHALMYAYYCMQSLNQVPKWFPTILITMSQIAQMFVGTFVCASTWYYLYIGKHCHNDIRNLIAGALMYGSYLYLFCDFAVRRYLSPPKPRAPKKLD